MPGEQHFPPAGLSPHTRGSPRDDPGRGLRAGIIPAYAGKPRCCAACSTVSRDYPRIRGEAQTRAYLTQRLPGLSPHTRGSPTGRAGTALGPGIIPAYAGKPSRSRPVPARAQDYPRIRGEAEAYRLFTAFYTGLSPHTRGSPIRGDDHRRVLGIIPAYAGKPAPSAAATTRSWDYPRIRGEAVPPGSEATG